ncbi:NmrA family NAD(P)-binding protein [Deinococcus cellulosilyticus]|uniref:NAD(P)-dependent oxidoreductase n=1 Tax=Deinococcus cellulosilyticus (strain DSM 18568 / NBRC 106333 / KACC 11606 / 5516J-15) TaxID=1223518 RepID=A0A511MYT3_DEIC1|nr:NmrA family NAD(P)-binding protein [Deinococcus cellulosilyticus]GEM45682.1 NAD(P)-dependent oxidoreductase [Deinococcus cellulosilyticus NBRC 106333 = KACC 11606]
MILVTGATGNVGNPLLHELQQAKMPYRAAVRDPVQAAQRHGNHPWVKFDFQNPDTYARALEGVNQVFVVLPPGQGSLKVRMYPFLDHCAHRKIEHMVYLSLLGAPQNPAAPHHQIEKHLQNLPLTASFLRASFFMQNLMTTHREEVIDGHLKMPAGHGRTSFVDTRDIARAAKQLFKHPPSETRGYDLTGSEALTYFEVAEILSRELGRNIKYDNPGLFEFVQHWRQKNTKWDFIMIMMVIYTTARLGRAGRVSTDLQDLLGTPPTTFAEFARDMQSCWPPRIQTQEKNHALQP